MTNQSANPSLESDKMSPGKLVLTAGLLAGIMDGLAAMIQTAIAGRSQGGLFRYIASGVFGNDAFTGSSTMIVYGILFHLFIAMGWTVVFYFLYPYLKQWFKNPVLLGVLYGLFVWVMMNQIVLKLANTPKGPFNIKGAAIGATVLIFCIGLPISLMFNKFYSGRK
ncbi:MAG TPA: hypothetical protein VIT44_04375 [Cyclobacteriaceae bacterium]